MRSQRKVRMRCTAFSRSLSTSGLSSFVARASRKSASVSTAGEACQPAADTVEVALGRALTAYPLAQLGERVDEGLVDLVVADAPASGSVGMARPPAQRSESWNVLRERRRHGNRLNEA